MLVLFVVSAHLVAFTGGLVEEWYSVSQQRVVNVPFPNRIVIADDINKCRQFCQFNYNSDVAMRFLEIVGLCIAPLSN